MKQRIMVWDVPTRVFHWALAFSFMGAYFTCASEYMALCHITCGFTLFGLIVFRLLWGLIGTPYSRFSQFVTSPTALFRYLSELVKGRPIHFIGHNPAGAISILILLLLGLVCTVSGWLIYDDVEIERLEEIHNYAASVMLAMVFVHIAGVFTSSLIHRENLVRSMIDGKKYGQVNQAIPAKHLLVAWLMLISLAGFWLWSYKDTLPSIQHFAHFLPWIVRLTLNG
jgi:cytochrome b